MEENKYYQPQIEEFHIGFKFELRNTYDSTDEDYNIWRECTIKDSHTILRLDSNFEEDYEHLLSNIEYELNKGNIRVKYLDKSDIESCGFKLIEDDGGTLYFEKNESDYSVWEIMFHKDVKDDYNIFIENIYQNKLTGKILLREHWSRYSYFKGEIKNISELQQVLKMIGAE